MYHYAGNNPVKFIDPTGRENELTDDQKTLFKVSVNTAKNDIKSLIKEINSKTISDKIMQNAKEFLGRDLTNKADRKEVISGLKKIHKSLKGIKEFEIDSRARYANTFAYVYPNKPKKVYIGGAFSRASDNGFDTKSGVFVHEASHFYKGLKTEDIVYGVSASKQLTLDSKTDAFKNADNWEYFYESSRRQ